MEGDGYIEKEIIGKRGDSKLNNFLTLLYKKV